MNNEKGDEALIQVTSSGLVAGFVSTILGMFALGVCNFIQLNVQKTFGVVLITSTTMFFVVFILTLLHLVRKDARSKNGD